MLEVESRLMVDNTFYIVIIGRNEGERLQRCFESVVGFLDRVVYVDSGSTDSSITTAESYGVDIVRLDMRVACSAARARNEGFQTLLEKGRQFQFVQFVDGDCEISG